MKLRTFIILLASIQFCMPGLAARPFGGSKGDVNQDGTVDVLDAIQAVNIILEIQQQPTDDELLAADCNGDGRLNVVDVLGIIGVILETGTCVSSCAEMDCDDENPCTEDYCDSLRIQCVHDTVSTGTAEICIDGIDNDCDGIKDCLDEDCLFDQDKDGHYAIPCGGDCDDREAQVHPGSAESCNGLDDDCDEEVDEEGAAGCTVYYQDLDRDGYGIHDDSRCLCAPSFLYSAVQGGDCNDNDASIYPGATEICDDSTDNDCNGYVDCHDSGCSTNPACLACGTAITDIDGNVYRTIQIGTQCWMAENLRVARYRNGDTIPNVADDLEWCHLTTGACCNYNNDVNIAATYGRLYNWYAVHDNRSIAPAGWHVPTDEEWQILVEYLGGFSVAGGKMKTIGTIEAGTGLWHSTNNGATNESGFSALPGGRRAFCATFDYLKYGAYFWSSTQIDDELAWHRFLNYVSASVGRGTGSSKSAGFSVRCVKN